MYLDLIYMFDLLRVLFLGSDLVNAGLANLEEVMYLVATIVLEEVPHVMTHSEELTVHNVRAVCAWDGVIGS